ncbi:MAG: xanthine dehydrogenase family protein molybdopterin-binding subunit [Deltaproteobacteria bacterium]|nr:MAG: xanthine dehydrogenase family protein molybdopterin-binding subunit [Deltaproteobacteria bacterium]
MKTLSVSRRQFLKGSGALIVSFKFFPSSPLLAQSMVEPRTDADPTQLDSWLAVASDGTVTVYSGKVDLGTGVETALAQIVAEELDVPFNKIHMSGLDTSKAIDQGITAGSRTIERGGPQLRQAAAAARQELLKLAAAKLNSTAEKLVVKDGVVSVAGDPKKYVTYAQLIGGKKFNVKITATDTGWNMKVAPEVRAKDIKDYKVVGTSQKRLELPPKLTGEFVYAHDVRVPGMLHGRVVRPPTITSKPASIDESAIKSIPGLVKVVQEGSFVGVVCTTEWSAVKAAKALKVTWSQPATKMPANSEEVFTYLKNTKSLRDQVTVNRGNPDAALAQASKTYEAAYRWPFQLHAMMGPSCAVADVGKEQATIYTGTQGSFETRTAVAEMLGFPEKNVRVLWREASGSYGRMGADDVAEDAALLSRAVGKPVRVQWMRDDEHAWEPKGPAQLDLARAGADAQGKIIAWDFADRGFPLTAASGRGLRLLASRQIGMKPTADGNSNGTQGGGEMYTFETQKCTAPLIPWVQADETPLRTGYLRAPGDIARCFASESFMDEIAADERVDPVQFRLRYLGSNKRGIDALTAVAKQANWQERPSPSAPSSATKATGRGVAISNRANAICGAVAEVEVDKTTWNVAVKRFILSHDCGLIINPDGLKNQIEGNIIQGVSRSLMEEVKFDSTGIKTLDWSTYPILRFPDVPEIEIVLLNRPEMPALGGGEPSSAPIAAAIANAIFDAVGVRLREAPFTPERVLAGMKKA